MSAEDKYGGRRSNQRPSLTEWSTILASSLPSHRLGPCRKQCEPEHRKTLKWKWIRKACLKRSRQNKLISHHQTLFRKLLALHVHRNHLSAAHGGVNLPAWPHQKPVKVNGNAWEGLKSHWNRLNESKVFFLCIITNYRWYHKLQSCCTRLHDVTHFCHPLSGFHETLLPFVKKTSNCL